MCLHPTWTRCLWRSEEGIRYPEIGVVDGCELQCGCLESNTGSLEEQPALLTTEASLQHPEATFYKSTDSAIAPAEAQQATGNRMSISASILHPPLLLF